MLFWLAYFLFIIFLGTRLRALGNIMHECSHYIFVKSKKWNIIIGHCIAIFIFDCFVRYKKEHFAHHAYLGDKTKDPDCRHYYKVRMHFFSNDTMNIIFSILNPYHWFLNLKSMRLYQSESWYISSCKIVYIIFLILISFLNWKLTFYFYLIPYLTTYQIFKIFSDIVDHDFLYEKENLKDRSRNHICKNMFINKLIFPRNDAYHLVHHLYPRLRVSQYPERHLMLLKKNNAYALKNHSCDLQKFSCSGIQE